MKKALSVLLSVLMLISIMQFSASAAIDTSDYVELTLDVPHTYEASRTKTSQYYKFTPTVDGVYSFTSLCDNASPTGYFLANYGDYIYTVYSESCTNPESTDDFQLKPYLFAGTEYYFNNSHYNATGNVSVTLSYVDDGTIALGEGKSFTVNRGANVFFCFTAEKSGTYTLTSTSDGDPRAYIYSSGYNELASADDNYSLPNILDFSLDVNCEAGQTYIYRISSYSGNAINVQLDFSFCAHENVTEYPETQPKDCSETGYDYGAYCNDCGKWLDERVEITVPHTWNATTFMCDVCSLPIEPTKAGKCGDDLTYTLYEVPVVDDEYGAYNAKYLIIEGTGDMYDYNYAGGYYGDYTAPWLSYSHCIDNVIISEGCTHIGDYAFTECYYGPMEITLPSTLKSIGKYAFDKCYLLQQIAFPDGLEEIGEFAFNACQGLVTVNWGKAVAPYDSSIFTGCTSLENIYFDEENLQDYMVSDGALLSRDGTKLFKLLDSEAEYYEIPACVTEICEYAFDGSHLYSIVIPGTVKKVGKYAFANCDWLYSVTVEDGVELLDDCCFYDCYNLEVVDIAGSVKRIGVSAFEWDWDIEELTLRDGIEVIDESAFDSLSVTSLYIPDSVTTIGAYAFENSWAITSVHISESLEVINEGVFYDCNELQSVTLPDSVVAVGKNAFGRCESLEAFHIGENVKELDGSAFLYDTPVYDITVDKDNPYFQMKNDGLYSADGKTLYLYTALNNPEKVTDENGEEIDETNYTVSSFVTKIGAGAFDCQRSLQSVTLPSGLKEIDDFAFRGTRSLSEVTIPAGVTRIGKSAFSDDYSANEVLTTVTFKSSTTLKEIDSGAFWQCKALTEFNLPTSVTYIGDDAFKYCNILDETFKLNANIEYIGDNAFSGCYSLNFGDIVLPECLTYLGTDSFYGTGVTGVTLNCNQVKYLNAFDSTDITELVIPDFIEEVGYNAFNSTPIASLTIGKGVKIIGEEAFYGCELTSVDIPENVENIDDYAFYWNDALTEITVRNKNAVIGESAFHPVENATIYGYANSTAQSYAEEYGFNFVAFAGCSHEYGDTWIKADDGTSHYKDCTLCGEDGRITEECTDGNTIDCVCDGCGREFGHIFTTYVSNGDATCTADGTKTAVCDRCEETDTVADEGSMLGHSFTNYVSNGDATCTADGTKTAVCDRCEETDTVADEDSRLGHTPVIDDAIAPECEKTGLTEGSHCGICGEVLTAQQTVAATGHSYIESENVKATCTEDGYITYKCTKCNHSYNETIEATDHVDEDGDGICDVCGNQINEIAIITVLETLVKVLNFIIVIVNLLGSFGLF